MPKRPHFKERIPHYQRRLDRLPLRQRFLIVCEGEKTEPKYFQGFPIPPDSIVDVRGVGMNTASLVREALRLRAQGNYDQVWVVFDRDSFPVENFNVALVLARQNKIKVAYSNEAFELWYILHFVYLDTGVSRDDYCERLGNFLGHPYIKKDPRTYNELLERQATAIRNAERLLSEYKPANPAMDKPSTTVHLLVKALNQLKWDFEKSK